MHVAGMIGKSMEYLYAVEAKFSLPSPAKGFLLPHSYFSPLPTRTCMKPSNFAQLLHVTAVLQVAVTYCFRTVDVDTFPRLTILLFQKSQHSTAQHSTAQHSTTQYSTARHSLHDCNGEQQQNIGLQLVGQNKVARTRQDEPCSAGQYRAGPRHTPAERRLG